MTFPSFVAGRLGVHLADRLADDLAPSGLSFLNQLLLD
jgi:hypothetical protein